MKPEAKHRVFFALWPDQKTRGQLVAVQAGLACSGKAVAAPNLHLTLAFIGEAGGDYLRCLRQAAEQVRCRSFDLLLNQVGYFVKPRILWLGPANTPSALHDLQQCLVRQLTLCGYAPEKRPFCPHVSLVRKAAEMPEPVFPPVHWRVRGFCLVESRSSSDGVEYRIMQEYFSGSG